MAAAKRQLPAGSVDALKISFEPIYLPKEEDDERIKRLSSKILECVAQAGRARRGKRGRPRACSEWEIIEQGKSGIEKLISTD